jgi:hypothetical protein
MAEARLPIRACQPIAIQVALKHHPYCLETARAKLEHRTGLRPTRIAGNEMRADERFGTAER